MLIFLFYLLGGFVTGVLDNVTCTAEEKAALNTKLEMLRKTRGGIQVPVTRVLAFVLLILMLWPGGILLAVLRGKGSGHSKE